MEISLSVLCVFLMSYSTVVQNVASLEPVASEKKKKRKKEKKGIRKRKEKERKKKKKKEKKLFRDMLSECNEERLWYCCDGLPILRQNFSEWKSTCTVLGKEGKISNKENFNLEGMSKNQQLA